MSRNLKPRANVLARFFTKIDSDGHEVLYWMLHLSCGHKIEKLIRGPIVKNERGVWQHSPPTKNVRPLRSMICPFCAEEIRNAKN